GKCRTSWVRRWKVWQRSSKEPNSSWRAPICTTGKQTRIHWAHTATSALGEPRHARLWLRPWKTRCSSPGKRQTRMNPRPLEEHSRAARAWPGKSTRDSNMDETRRSLLKGAAYLSAFGVRPLLAGDVKLGEIKPFPLDAVRLHPSPYLTAVESNGTYLLRI